MKKFKQIIVLWLLCINVTNIYAQDYFMYVNGEKHYFEISPNKIIAQFEEEITNTTAKNIVQKSVALQLSDISEIGHKGLKLVTFSNANKVAIDQFISQSQGKNRDSILYSGPVFIDEEGNEIAAITNQIIVRLKKEADYPVLLKSIISYDIGNVEISEFDNRTYLLRVNYSSLKNAMQIANELYETELFDAAKTSIDEIHEIALGQGIGLYVFVDFETQVALLRIVVHNFRYTYDICNFPFNRISQTISKNGLSISVAGNAYETCELSGGVIQYEYYNIILTSLKIQQS
jgi:hypothetical protein